MNELLEQKYHLAKKIREVSAFHGLSEQEIAEVLDGILSLQVSLWQLSDDEFVEEITSTQGLLSRWQRLVEFALTAKQSELVYTELCNWDNEGGRV